jgi:hypothetical protein
VHDCIAHAYNCTKTQGMLNMIRGMLNMIQGMLNMIRGMLNMIQGMMNMIQGMLNMVFDVGASIREKGDGKTFVYGDA